MRHLVNSLLSLTMPLTRRQFIMNGILLTAGLALADTFWAEQFLMETNEFYLNNATKNSSNIKFIQVSDLHLQSVKYRHKRLAEKLNMINPDLILFTGDAIDKGRNLPVLNDFLKLINRDINKVAILGNWEYWGQVNLPELKSVYAQHNCTLLINENKRYVFRDKSVSITGIDDLLGGTPDYSSAIANYHQSDYHVILTHCPQHRDILASEADESVPIDFVLSGHTHGGQLNIFGYTPFMPRGSGNYVKGWYSESHPKLYVSKGIGTSLIPARFGARAEIGVFNLLG